MMVLLDCTEKNPNRVADLKHNHAKGRRLFVT